MGDEEGKELALGPMPWGAMEGVRSDKHVVGSVLRHSMPQTSVCTQIPPGNLSEVLILIQ